MGGTNPAAVDPQQTILTQTGNYYQITNGLTGVRILNGNGQTRSIPITSVSVTNKVATVTTSVNNDLETAVSNPPWQTPVSANLQGTISGITGTCSYLNGQGYTFVNSNSPTAVTLNTNGVNCTGTGGTLTVPETRLAPIQGIQFKDGSWSPSGSLIQAQETDQAMTGWSLNANSITTSVVENGPIETVIKITYAYNYTSVLWLWHHCPASGWSWLLYLYHYLQVGQPSVIIEENTDMAFAYQLNVYPNVQPNQGQYVTPHFR